MAQAERRGAAVTGVWPGDLRCAPSHEHYVEVVVAAGGQFDRRFDLACEVALHKRGFRVTGWLTTAAEVLWRSQW